MEIFLKWLLLAGIQTGATMSPGPAFAMTVRNTLAYGRRAGIFTAIGLGAGVGAHVLFVLLGFAVIISQSVLLFTLIKYAGAAYLIFIGAKALFAHKKENADDDILQTQKSRKNISDLKALWIGFLTNLLNPKAMIFFSAVFSQFLEPNMGYEIMGLYFITMVSIEILWFSTLTTILTHKAVKARFTNFAHWVERVCGGLLVGLGVKLASSRALAP